MRKLARAPKSQTFNQLRDLQRLTFDAICYPLSPANRLPKTWTDGRPTRTVLSEFIKPNDRLTASERIEIYSKSYWFRLLDCLYDDYPGLLAILGQRKFHRLRVAYLERYPSQSFTLRNLGSRLTQFIAENPALTAPHTKLALDMARFEWAQIQAFDGPAHPPLALDDLHGANPARFRLGLQPYITLLKLEYPLDDFIVAVKKRNAAFRTEASNAIDEERKPHRHRNVKLPRPSLTHLVVHRYNNNLYFKRLEPSAFALLTALDKGHTLQSAVSRAKPAPDPAELQEWFKTWMELGWFCKCPKPSKRGTNPPTDGY